MVLQPSNSDLEVSQLVPLSLPATRMPVKRKAGTELMELDTSRVSARGGSQQARLQSHGLITMVRILFYFGQASLSELWEAHR